SRGLFYVLARGAQQGALEVMPDQSATRVEQLIEQLEQPAFCSLGLAAFGLDALTHVMVEEVHGLARGAIDRSGVLLAQLDQSAQRHARGDELHAGGD